MTDLTQWIQRRDGYHRTGRDALTSITSRPRYELRRMSTAVIRKETYFFAGSRLGCCPDMSADEPQPLNPSFFTTTLSRNLFTKTQLLNSGKTNTKEWDLRQGHRRNMAFSHSIVQRVVAGGRKTSMSSMLFCVIIIS